MTSVIAVTGATGFTGPFVVSALRRRFPRAAIRCIVRASSDTSRVARSGVSFATADLRDRVALPVAFAGADTLVNVASLGFDWTDNLITSARSARIPRGIFISTTAILTRLGVASKPVRERAEALVRDSGIDWTILRPTMIYGTPDDRNIARLIRFVRRWPVVPIVGRHALQQPVHVEDVADAVAAALATQSTIGHTYTVSGGDALTMESLIRETAAALDRRPLLVPLPLWPLKTALVGWAFVARPPITAEQLSRIKEDKSFDFSDAARDFGYAPRRFRDGVRGQAAKMTAAPQ